MSIEYRCPRTQAELDDSIRCTVESFGGNEDFFTSIVKDDPWFQMENTRACFLDGKVVSVVAIFERPMQIEGSVVKAGCIGSVGTPPEHRRKGYSLGVLQDTARYLHDVGYDLSVLFTGVRAHYAKGGWVVYPIRHFDVKLPETLGKPSSAAEILLFDSARDLEDVRAVYDSYNLHRTGTFVRSEAYWDKRPLWRPQNSDQFLVAREDGRTVAYCCGHGDSIREVGVLPGCDDALAAALVKLLSPLRKSGCERVRAGVPADCGAVLESIGCSLRRQENANPMIRLVNLPSMMQNLIPVFEERLVAAGVDAAKVFTLRTEVGACPVSIDGGNVTVGATTQATEILVSQEQMTGLLVGGMTIDSVAASNRLQLDSETVEILRALFPPDELHHWGWDGY